MRQRELSAVLQENEHAFEGSFDLPLWRFAKPS